MDPITKDGAKKDGGVFGPRYMSEWVQKDLIYSFWERIAKAATDRLKRVWFMK